MDFNQPPVVRVFPDEDHGLAEERWPMTIPAVAQLMRDGLDLASGVTFLVGENGSGKSTIVEAIAMAYGLSPEGGSPEGQHSTRPSESQLSRSLRLRRGLGTGRWGFFLRSETMHGWYTYLEDSVAHFPPGLRVPDDPVFHEMSHGESFMTLLRSRFNSPGFYCLDEPEAALSFSSTLGLMSVLSDVVARRGQVLCATHSPVLAAMPGATILEVGEWGMRRAEWDELDLTYHWRSYLGDPSRYLRHVLES